MSKYGTTTTEVMAGKYGPRPRFQKTEEGRSSNAKYQREYMADNPEQRRKKIEYNKKKMRRIRLEVMGILGRRICVKCGVTDVRALQVDHKDGGGTKELKAKGNHSMYYRYLREPEEARKNLQVLCANCNQIKREENKELYEVNPHTLI